MPDTHVENIRRIMICVNRIDGIYYAFAKKVGIKDNILSLLYALNDGQQHTQKEICDEWLIPRTTINTVVKECVKKGYVTLEKERHTREKRLLLTAEGAQYVSSLMTELFAMEIAAYERTAKEYGNEFVHALHRFTDELERRVLSPTDHD